MTPFLPLRKFGQHFLVDQHVLERIVGACSLSKDDRVLEIGPGPGALTRAILPLVKSLDAVEADQRFANSLSQELACGSLTVHHADILKFDVAAVAKHAPITVVGNIPYNISTPIIERMIDERLRIRSLLMTVQYEFGVRLTASLATKDYCALTCLINFFAVPRILFRISKRAFRPVPKVESCFMRIDFRREPLVRLEDEGFFRSLVRMAFHQRRKTIANALGPVCPRKGLQDSLLMAGIQEKARPEEVRVEEYAKLANILNQSLKVKD